MLVFANGSKRRRMTGKGYKSNLSKRTQQRRQKNQAIQLLQRIRELTPPPIDQLATSLNFNQSLSCASDECINHIKISEELIVPCDDNHNHSGNSDSVANFKIDVPQVPLDLALRDC